MKFRHCPATVKDELATVRHHCAQREGDSQILSQETGPVNNARTLPRGVCASLSYRNFITYFVGSCLVG